MDDLIRSKMHDALDIEQPSIDLRARIVSSLPFDEQPVPRFQSPSFKWAGGVVAALLALALVAVLLYSRGAVGQPQPAHRGPFGEVTINSPVSFRCLLPVVTGGLNPAAYQVQLPDGSVVSKSAQPDNGVIYDVQLDKWLSKGVVSPDGKTYAYGTGMTQGAPDQKGTVHIVDVRSGTDRQIWSGAGSAQVLGFLSKGVYFFEYGLGPLNAGFVSMWLVDPVNPGLAHRTMDPTDRAFGGKWLISPLGLFSVGGEGTSQYPDRVIHVDLVTGVFDTWFINPSGPTFMVLLGLDGEGHPVVAMDKAPPVFASDGSIVYRGVQDDASRVVLVTGVNQSTLIADGSDNSFLPNSATGDAHGVWFGELGSVWLYDPSSGLQKVFSMPPSLFPPGPGKVIPSPTPGTPTQPPDRPSGIPILVFGRCV